MGVKAVNFAAHDTIESLLGDWVIHLKAEGAAERTPTTYVYAVEQFTRWLTAHGLTHEVGALRRDDIDAWTSDTLKHLKPATVSLRWRALHVFFKWLESEELVTVSPMSQLRPPEVPVKVVPLLPPDAAKKLLKTCLGKDFRSRRDMALLALLMDTGARLAEVTNLRYTPNDPDTNDVHLDAGYLRVMGKGQVERTIPLGRLVAKAISTYLLSRRQHPAARLPWLWLSGSRHARLTDSGIRQMVEDRATEAGLGHLHPHMFRHNFAHSMKLTGMRDEEIMAIAGWKAHSMLTRYGGSAAEVRAKAAHAKHSLMDNL